MNELWLLLPVMILMSKATRMAGPMWLDVIACFMPSCFIYCVPKLVILAIWYRGKLTFPVPTDPAAHAVSGSISMVICCSVLIYAIRKRRRLESQ